MRNVYGMRAAIIPSLRGLLSGMRGEKTTVGCIVRPSCRTNFTNSCWGGLRRLRGSEGVRLTAKTMWGLIILAS